MNTFGQLLRVTTFGESHGGGVGVVIDGCPIEILSGVYEGATTGTPIALLIRNTDARAKDYDRIAEQFRPGHADYTYWQKYGTRDPRGGGRSSARDLRGARGPLARA